jgi:hypothetical protein
MMRQLIAEQVPTDWSVGSQGEKYPPRRRAVERKDIDRDTTEKFRAPGTGNLGGCGRVG